MEENIKNKKRWGWIIFLILCLIILTGVFSYKIYLHNQETKRLAEREAMSLRMAIITDIDHCPSRESASMKNLYSFLSDADRKKADFVTSLGDNASHRLRDCSKTADMDARSIAQKLRSLGKPVHLILGDHDIGSSEESYQAWLETSQKNDTNYSFDMKNTHIIILDTVLGGEILSPPCEKKDDCNILFERLAALKTVSYSKYRLLYPDAKMNLKEEKNSLEYALDSKKREINLTRSWGDRDIGRVSEKELEWLRYDLSNTPLERVVIMSDHPLFPFATDKKSYDIANGDKVREILEQSDKRVVAISGEAHVWHEEFRNGIQYYIVDEFRKNNGSWAFFSWLPEGYELEKTSH